MEKQDKTFGSLTILDKVYKPTIEDIIFYKVECIDRMDKNIVVHFHRNDYMIGQPSHTVRNSHFEKKVCVNRAKAVEIQKEMRKERLIKLQEEVQKAIDELNEFSQKYF